MRGAVGVVRPKRKSAMTKNRRFLSFVSSVSLVTVLALGAASPAMAESSPAGTSEQIPAAALADVDQHLQGLGVSSSDREGLIDSLIRGEAWDSMNGAKPVSVDSTTPGKTVTRFADGSITVSSVEQPSRISSSDTKGVSRAAKLAPPRGCKALPNSKGWIRRADCTVKVDLVLIMLAFEADYSVKSGYGRIDAVRYPQARTIGGWHDSLSLKIGRKVSSGKAPATARLSARVGVGPFKGIGVSNTAWTQLNVLSSATITHN